VSDDRGENESGAVGRVTKFPFDVCVVGGCGHVGLPLAITLAKSGLSVRIHDIDARAVALVSAGTMPFLEPGAEDALRKVIGRSLVATTEPSVASSCQFVIVVIGTPVDRHLNPTFHVMRRFFEQLAQHLREGQTVILRSTVYPGTTKRVRELLASLGKNVNLAFCPERVAEGKAMEELVALPQIIAGCDPASTRAASALFGLIARSLIELEPLEAEFTKIFANVWRYIQFATANQFFMIATEAGHDFPAIHQALIADQPRLARIPSSGFAAGPCLFKDTMQLSASYENNFALGHAAMLVNEGLPNFLVAAAKARYDLSRLTMGILGLSFKVESDDPRESLSYKLRKLLEYEARDVLCSDPYVEDAQFLAAELVVERADVIWLGAPHARYRTLAIPPDKAVVDVWNVLGRGTFSGEAGATGPR
jgi:UDP-N-acetyl-D-mannosaminuronic acid dehydrogenase